MDGEITDNKKSKRNELKFAFMGTTQLINYRDHKPSYKDLIKSVLRAFNIPADFKRALILKNARGDIFDKITFLNYIRYFPNPSNIIFVRIDFSNVKTFTAKYKNINKDSNGAPLVRQNCFLGRLPVEHTVVSTSVASPPLEKRRRLLIHSKKPKQVKHTYFFRI